MGRKKVHPMGEGEKRQEAEGGSVILDTYGGRVHVEWDPQAAVTPLGQLPFFIEFLKTGELFDLWVEECPAIYRSNNAPKKVEVLGTLLLSVLGGQTRYAHIDAVRYDTVNPSLLGMGKVVGSKSARRAFLGVEEGSINEWLKRHMRRCYEPLLYEPWIMDVDTHVKLLFGHQEGAVLGYNPKKPGRPSHVLHTYFMANTRLALDVEVRPGNETAAKYTMPGLWEFLDELPKGAWPKFIRADCAYGNDRSMTEAEARGVDFLYKLRQTLKIKGFIQKAFGRRDWVAAGQGWEGVEDRLQLMGWTRKRRVVLLRRRIERTVVSQAESNDPGMDGQLTLMESIEETKPYEYAVLVTSMSDPIGTIAHHYRDRGDMENNYDEQTNQWGWGGYTTQDLKRCGVMARIIALVYNWWSLFVRLAIPDRHAEAITSRPLLLHGVGRQVTHGDQTVITVTNSHAQAQKTRHLLRELAGFLNEVKSTARQLSRDERWRLILSRTFVHFLHGRLLGSPGLLPGPG